jgi:hypothetical protein
MNVIIRFTYQSRQTNFSWEQIFNITHNDARTLELVLGYVYALALVKPSTSIINISIDTMDYTIKDFLKLPIIKRYFISTHAHPPKIGEKVDEYLKRIKRQFNLGYLIVITPNPNDEKLVHLIQFDNNEFLQGFISVLRAFNKTTMDYIVTIYGRNGREYTIRY